MIIHADCLEAMADLQPESVHAVVTDPPYGLGFMGKTWDTFGGPLGVGHGKERAGGREPGGAMKAGDSYDRSLAGQRGYQEWTRQWATLALRLATPGAHLLVSGGTRTMHRQISGIEDAGWEIRDCLVWGYASGFPKSHNLEGDWAGWGTALKPAWEPIVLARKRLRGTVAANVAEHGTGALNIDGTRIAVAPDDPVNDAVWTHRPSHVYAGGWPDQDGDKRLARPPEAGRWPPNVILTDPIFDGGVEGVVGGGWQSGGGNPPWRSDEAAAGSYGGFAGGTTYSRFFLIPKADRPEREPVWGHPLTPGVTNTTTPPGSPGSRSPRAGAGRGGLRANVHPTVKPVDLMRHLVRLVTPPGGIVLDPFLGSGTTGIACEMEGFDWIGIEREAEYVAIAEARLVGVQRGMGLAG